MSQTKAQLVSPVGVVTASGINVSGVVTATSFSGSGANLTGVGIGSTGSVNTTGIITASSFVGNVTGNATGLSGSPNLNVGVVTASSFSGNLTGNVTGNATGLSGSPNVTVGVITATSLVGDGSNITNLNVTTFPSGTLMLFQQTAAPTGWTKQTTHNNKALRVVSGAASSGGTTNFTSVFTSRSISGTVGNTTLTIDQIPSHTHTAAQLGSQWLAGGMYQSLPINSNTGATGGGNSHNHSFTGTALDFDVQYVDLIIASKN